MLNFIKFLHSDGETIGFQTFGEHAEYFSSRRNKPLRNRLIRYSKQGLTVSVAVNRIEGNKRSAENVTKINARLLLRKVCMFGVRK